MGIITRPKKVKLIIGLISSNEDLLTKIKISLEKTLRNKVDYTSPMMDFNYTDYYKKEMGSPLKRKFLSFEKPLDLERIYAIKIMTNALESKFAKCGKRMINIDPGYLDMAKLVLFSTKDYTHRIHLNDGIFAEVTLYYKDDTFNPWPWTYPDYKSKEYIAIFNHIRGLYKKGA